ncbi:hypothetical protein BCR34DRAFT_593257 [Clohesyomyces aquaticus]|uniref:PNPLA domain-containing protein n=1 Tax=Clohesyomyces aquaticus TaxID=1231657 RepID=A0A1Y1YKR0_9PLEO|nr:hypothetical protein BCR34DRAFT_593257 [Clohesyomyces aquaticus]
MEQGTTTQNGGESNPLDTEGLCLLSLDGGRVRGLSTLYILKYIMDRLNHERKNNTPSIPPVKPCDVFDLIGGTSTGGLIAIMLGRLEMDVDGCIAAYNDLAAAVFGKKSRFPFVQSGRSETDLLNDGVERGCRTFVCSIDRDMKDMIRLRSYSLPDEPNIPATICKAALATSAATTFFDPVDIEGRTFADGGFGANNPVDEVEGEAANIWRPETRELGPLVKCFISIGTGNPGKKPFEDGVPRFLGETVVQIVTETEATERKFIARWRKHFDEKKYFRFNVEFRNNKCRVYFCPSQTQRSALWIMPFQRNPHFVGRSEEIAKIETILSRDDRCARAAIFGLGGVGKTQIALEFVNRWKDKHPDCSVFWIPVTTLQRMLEAYLDIGKLLRISGIEQNKANAESLVCQHLSDEASGKWLLVFDNADSTDIWMESTDGGTNSSCRIDGLPRSNKGSILFTTRTRKLATKLVGKNVVSVDEMDDTTARRMLKEALINRSLLDDRQATEGLLKKLTYPPLAISQAAAYVNANRVDLHEYAKLLDDTEQNQIELLSEDFEDEGRYQDTKNPIATGTLGKWTTKALDQLERKVPKHHNRTNRSEWRIYLPHARYSLDADENWDPLRKAELLFNYGKCTVADGRYHEAGKAFANALGTQKKRLGPQHLSTLESMNRLARTYRNQGRLDAAVQLRKEVLEIRKTKLGPEHPDTLHSMNNISITYTQQGQWDAAKTLQERVVETQKNLLGAQHHNTLQSMSNLAVTYWQTGHSDVAEKLQVEILDIRKRVLGAEHPSTLITMNNLAYIWKDQGRIPDAISLMRECARKSSTPPKYSGYFYVLGNGATPSDLDRRSHFMVHEVGGMEWTSPTMTPPRRILADGIVSKQNIDYATSVPKELQVCDQSYVRLPEHFVAETQMSLGVLDNLSGSIMGWKLHGKRQQQRHGLQWT